jgi:hypothetical protein
VRQRVGDPAGRDAARAAVADIAVEVRRIVVQPRAVVVVHHSGEHGGLAAAECGGVDSGSFKGFPGRFQKQALLRVGGQGLTRTHAEELRVEVVGVVQEPTLARVGLTQPSRNRVVEPLDVPVPVGRESADRVDFVRHQTPQVFRGPHASGVATAHCDDRDGFAGRHGRGWWRLAGFA